MRNSIRSESRLNGTPYIPSDRGIATGQAFTGQLVHMMDEYDQLTAKSEEYDLIGNTIWARNFSDSASRNAEHMKDWASDYGYKPEVTLIYIETVFPDINPDGVLIHEMDAY